MWILLAVQLLGILNSGHSAIVGRLHCGPGEFVKNGASCEPCPDGTYMDQLSHTNLECIYCQRGFYFNHEVELEKCTKTKDTVIGCTKDHYMNLNTGDRTRGYCYRCQKCGVSRMKHLPYVVENCTDFKDTVCGADSPVYCGEGQFVSRNLRTGQEFCADCPEGTFMAEARHQNIECRRCSKAFSFNREVEVKKCTKTADSSILCEKNFYRVEAGPFIPGYCQRCTDCGFKPGRPVETKPCGKYTDTVCG